MEDNIRNFEEDLANSNNPALLKSWERLIRHKFGEETEIMWKNSLEVQKGMGTDLTIKTKQGRRYSIELKTRANSCYNNNDGIMEIVSHIYDKEDKETRKKLYSKEGWLYTTTAEYIFHGTLDKSGTKIIESIFYHLGKFKSESYKSEFEKYKVLWLATKFNNGNFQLTINKLIPKDIIKQDTIEFWEWNNDNRS